MFDVQSLVKYLLEGAAVAVAAYYIPRRTVDLKEVAIIAFTAAMVFAVLDLFAPAVSGGARQGAGFGIGYNIATGLGGLEGFEDEKKDEKKDEKDEKKDSSLTPVTESDDADDAEADAEEDEPKPHDAKEAQMGGAFL
jgi:hypothetical protein